MGKESKRERKSSNKSHRRHSSSRKRKKHRHQDYIDESYPSESELSHSKEECSNSVDSYSSSSSISSKRKSHAKKDPKKSRSRSKSKKRSSKGEKKERKHSKRRSKHDKKTHKHDSSKPSIPPSSFEILQALLTILTSYPDLSTQIIHMLRQLSGSGTSFDLSQMKDPNAALLLEAFFETLRPYGVQRQSQGSSVWLWKINSSSGISKKWDEWFLIKIVSSLMDQGGFSIEAVTKYEIAQKNQRKKIQSKIEQDTQEKESNSNMEQETQTNNTIDQNTPNFQNSSNIADKAFTEMQEFTKLLLNNFSKASTATSNANAKNETLTSTKSLANELIQFCQLLSDGETLCLDNIPNIELRMGLQILLTRAGLDYYEMDPESDDDENEEKETSDTKDDPKSEPCMGFGLPDGIEDHNADSENNTSIERIQTNIKSIIESCQAFQKQSILQNEKGKPQSRIKGPSLPDKNYDPNNDSIPNNFENDDSSSDEDGPAPAGSAMARRRGQVGPRMPTRIVKAMAAQRSEALLQAKEGIDVSKEATTSSSREEWMMKPGEHDFLQGIVQSGDILKNRTFKNEKQRGQSLSRGGCANEDQPPIISARLKKQMEDVIQAHAEARGPSLIDQHRQKKAEEKKASNGDWKWSRDDLDAGRRVDKKALGQVLGGAAKGLNEKFQGSAARGFM